MLLSSFFSILLAMCLLTTSCARYTPRATPFRLPQSYANVQNLNGLNVAASSWQGEAEARAAFGFDVIRMGLLPVQIVFDNQTFQTFQINPSQTFLVNDREELFPVLDNQSASERVQGATGFKEAARSLGKGALWGSAAGAAIGAAIGVASGRSAGDYAMRGAVTGAVAGGILGIGQGSGHNDVTRQIADELANKQLKNNPIRPQEISQGIIFFPAEAGLPKQLKLQLRDKDTDKVVNLSLSL